jgi:hypothetical protein
MKVHSLTLLAAAMMLTLASCSKRLAPQRGLVGEYLFEGNANDKSSYHNHGQVHEAVLVPGHSKKFSKSAYEFNGIDQFITIPHARQNNFRHGQDFSISLWVAVSQQHDVGSTLNDILRKWRGNTQGYPFAIVYYNHTAPDSLRNRFSFVRYDGSICRNSPQIFSRPQNVENAFIHLVVIKDGNLIRIYQNAQLVSETVDNTKPESTCGSDNNSEITIGTRGNRVRFFKGVVDDVRIYHRALNQEEINLLFRL